MVVKQILEPELEECFDEDSFGYRPGKSAHQAVERTRQRCWRYDWVLDLDIKGFFDAIDHELLMKAITRHCKERWVLLYIKRWLKAPVVMPDGKQQARCSGTPQGGVISPLLANLFLHYGFDKWMRRRFSSIPFVRYADDAICHCRTRQEAERLKEELERRFADCKLTLHPEKTKVVYCKDDKRKGSFEQIHFTFLGFTFRPRQARSKRGATFTSFLPAVSPDALKRMRARIREWSIPKFAMLPLEDLARMLNPVLKGWWQYYGKFYSTEMWKLFTYFDERLGAWLRCKHKPLKDHRGRSLKKLNQLARHQPMLFVHWARLGRATVG